MLKEDSPLKTETSFEAAGSGGFCVSGSVLLFVGAVFFLFLQATEVQKRNSS